MRVSHHSVFTGQMPFLPPNQQRRRTEGKYWRWRKIVFTQCRIVTDRRQHIQQFSYTHQRVTLTRPASNSCKTRPQQTAEVHPWVSAVHCTVGTLQQETTAISHATLLGHITVLRMRMQPIVTDGVMWSVGLSRSWALHSWTDRDVLRELD